MIAGRFQPLGRVEEGGALRARDLETAQTVTLEPTARLGNQFTLIFHPALLTVFAIVDQDGQCFAAQEFVAGQTLERVVGAGFLHPRRAAAIVSEIADGVAELHARQLTHGNISTRTVFLTAKGKARLSLAAAEPLDEPADLQALRSLLDRISGREHPHLREATSAAVMAAILRQEPG